MVRRTAAVLLLALAGAPAAQAQCQLEKLRPDPQYNGFGIHVALSPTLAAITTDALDDAPGTALYAYRRSGNTLVPAGLLTPNEPLNPNITRYGHAVAVTNDLVVTSDWQYDFFIGRVFVFRDTGAGFVQTDTLTPPAGVNEFGSAIATDGARLVVTSTGSGDAWVYTRNPDHTFSLVQSDLGTAAIPFSAFGTSIAMDGDTLAIGAPGSGSPDYFGAVHLFTWDGSAYVPAGQIAPPEPGPFPPFQGGFGFSVALHGNLLVVGEPGADVDGAPLAGKAHVYRRINGNWILEATLTSPGTLVFAEFGRRVAILPESQTILIGAEGDSLLANTAGAVFTWDYSAGELTIGQMIYPDDAAEGQRFGAGIAASAGRVLIGARSDTSYGTRSLDGSAYYFLPSGECPASCPADFNTDGAVNASDITTFLSDWFADRANGTFNADFNGDSAVDASDITAYLAAWFADRASGNCNG